MKSQIREIFRGLSNSNHCSSSIFAAILSGGVMTRLLPDLLFYISNPFISIILYNNFNKMREEEGERVGGFVIHHLLSLAAKSQVVHSIALIPSWKISMVRLDDVLSAIYGYSFVTFVTVCHFLMTKARG